MALSSRNMIAILVTIVVLLGVFFMAILYYPAQKRARRVARSRAILEAQVEAVAPAREGAPQETAMIDAMDMDVNFFKKRDFSPRRGIPDLLEQINRMGNQINIRFVAVRPLDEEDAPEYRKYPFMIEARGAYPELVNFVNRMENGMRLSLSDLRIETDQKDNSTHRLRFILNIFELKDDLQVGQGESGDRGVSLRPKDMDLVAVYRDPFSLTKRTGVVQLPKKPKPTKVAMKKRRPPKLVLMGIMDIAGRRVAIINNKILRQGEVIRGQRIDRIEHDHVVIALKDSTYPLYLKGSAPRRRREVGR